MTTPPGQHREVLRLAVPAFLALVAEPLFLMADSAIVGRLGVAPLAGLGVAGAVLLTGVNIFVFLAYGATAVLTAVNQRWGVGIGMLAVVTAIVPYATIPFDIWAHRTGRLEGDWRREATDDPRDRVWFDRLVRWMLRHPYLLGTLILVGVVTAYVVLLTIGPPIPKAD